MKGYKAVLQDYTSKCGDFEYEVGEIYTHKGALKICESGFHFCKNLIDCFEYYDFDEKTHVFEIEALGEVITEENKSVTNQIKIVRELSWNEVITLVNSGDWNSGYKNSGDWNSGNRNSGNGNSGDGNSGDGNSGYKNSGDWNSGNRNSGDGNSGDWNSGDWNLGNYNSGCFNTTTPKMRFFDKKSNWYYKDWVKSRAYDILNTMPLLELIWVEDNEMTDEEKKRYPDFKITKGFLKEKSFEELAKERLDWWNNLSEEDLKEIQSIPNFDKAKFFAILGIKEGNK